jgi:hypothetical protein
MWNLGTSLQDPVFTRQRKKAMHHRKNGRREEERNEQLRIGFASCISI